MDTGEGLHFMFKMKVSMQKHLINGNNPIEIFNLLARFVREADLQRMSEAQGLVALL